MSAVIRVIAARTAKQIFGISKEDEINLRPSCRCYSGRKIFAQENKENTNISTINLITWSYTTFCIPETKKVENIYMGSLRKMTAIGCHGPVFRKTPMKNLSEFNR